jgi:hypothetical protein
MSEMVSVDMKFYFITKLLKNGKIINKFNKFVINNITKWNGIIQKLVKNTFG